MNFTHYKKAGDKVFAVNPFPKVYESELGMAIWETCPHWSAFETWLSTQPPIYADPSIKDGVMYKVDELEIVWQYFEPRKTFPGKWSDSDPDNYLLYSSFEDFKNAYPNFQTRQYATLKQPVKQEEKDLLMLQKKLRDLIYVRPYDIHKIESAAIELCDAVIEQNEL